MFIFFKYILCKCIYVYFLNTLLCLIFHQTGRSILCQKYVALVQYHLGSTAYDSISKRTQVRRSRMYLVGKKSMNMYNTLLGLNRNR